MACFALRDIALSRRQPDFIGEGIEEYEEEAYHNQPDRQENLGLGSVRFRRQSFAKRGRITLNDFR